MPERQPNVIVATLQITICQPIQIIKHWHYPLPVLIATQPMPDGSQLHLEFTTITMH
jgi:hypothetical protein